MNWNPLARFRKSPPKLRNKPNGMAWIHGIETCAGIETINGRAVRTVRIDEHGMWEIYPKQHFIAKGWIHFSATGVVVGPGPVVIASIHDGNLRPWKDDGVTPAEVADLYHLPTAREVFTQ